MGITVSQIAHREGPSGEGRVAREDGPTIFSVFLSLQRGGRERGTLGSSNYGWRSGVGTGKNDKGAGRDSVASIKGGMEKKIGGGDVVTIPWKVGAPR